MAPRTGYRCAGFIAAALTVTACAYPLNEAPRGSPPVPRTPASVVSLPAPPAPAAPEQVGIPEDLEQRARELTLGDAIDLALRNSPTTRETWAAARSAAAEIGETRADRLPELDATVSGSRVKQSAVGGQFKFQQTTYGPGLELIWRAYDFGSTRASVEKTRRALATAGWTHNQAIQDVVLAVQEAYYSYAGAKAQALAAAAAVKEAEASLQAANDRHDAGVATIADVLQARTALSSARLDEVEAEGRIQTLLGAFVTSLGLPANTSLDVGELPVSAPVAEVTDDVDALIEEALGGRPDLMAARSRALEAASEVDAAKADRYPTFDLHGALDRVYYGSSTGDPYSDNWSISALLTYPLFDGQRRQYALRRAQQDAEAARARAATAEQAIVLDVWQSYQSVKTAARRVATSADLLESAEQSEQVALGRYKEGVGSILDLLTAQAVLASARAQEIAARSAWFVAVARLAHATGTLGPAPAAAGNPE